MKTFKFYNLFALIFTVTLVISCVKSDDFDTPDTTLAAEPVLDGELVEIASLVGQYEQEQADFTFENTNTYVEGYVISNDEAGNFFEEIIIQDKLENPTFGVRVLLDVNPLFTRYEMGRKIYIKLDGLTLGISNGVLTLGVAGAEFIEKIPAALEEDYFFRSTEKGIVVPKNITIEDLPKPEDDDFEDAYLLTNLYVEINDVQFAKNEVVSNSLTYASEASDNFDGERTLESCNSDDSLIFSTSTFADFKAVLLPSGKGSVTGILTMNFFGDELNLVINDTSTVLLTDENRCDPLEGFFFEDFEGYSSTSQVEAAGWTNQIINGTTSWFLDDFQNNSYIAISAFNSSDVNGQTWLVTPTIDMDSTTNEVLTMDIQTNFNNAEILTVWYSTDFTGDASTATWTQLLVEIPVGSISGFGTFENVGNIDLSFINGTAHFGFLYQGSVPNATTRYHIDNIEIIGN